VDIQIASETAHGVLTFVQQKHPSKDFSFCFQSSLALRLFHCLPLGHLRQLSPGGSLRTENFMQACFTMHLTLLAPAALEVPQLCCSFLVVPVVLVDLVDLVDRGPPLAVLCPLALALGRV